MGTDQRAQVWAKTDGHCWYCGKKMNPWDDFTVDHMDSRKQGGGDELPNLIPACKSCNSRKNSKNVEEYRAYMHAKGYFRFWGERTYVEVLPLVIPALIEQEESPWEPTIGCIQDLGLFITNRRRNHPNATAVMLALLFQTSEWVMSQDSGYDHIKACLGSITMRGLNKISGLSPAAVLNGIFWLEEHQWLDLIQHEAREGWHRFIFRVAAYLNWGTEEAL